MADLMIIECQNCGNSFKGDISQPFICPKCREKNVHVSDSKHTSVFKRALATDVKEEIRNEDVESTDNILKEETEEKNMNVPLTVASFKMMHDIRANNRDAEYNVSDEDSKNINPVQSQINEILAETERKNKEKAEVSKAINTSVNIADSSTAEIIKRLNKLDMEYSIIEALLKEILSRLSNS